jgi:plasmid stability protein
MGAVTIRNLDDDELTEPKARAKAKGRSAEAEMREILEKAAQPAGQINLVIALAEFGRKYRKELSQIDFDNLRDKSEIEPAVFE